MKCGGEVGLLWSHVVTVTLAGLGRYVAMQADATKAFWRRRESG
jgi:hypothetical protein